MIVLQDIITVKCASKSDISAILGMVQGSFFGNEGDKTLLKVTHEELAKRIAGGNFFLAYVGNDIAGCDSLELYDGLAEKRTTYVKPQFEGIGVGKSLDAKIEERAKELGYHEAYALVNHNALPKFLAWRYMVTGTPPKKLENYCSGCSLYYRNTPNNENLCKEIAVVKNI